MRELDAPPADIARAEELAQQAAARRSPDEGNFGVHADNWPSVEAFLGVATQWQHIVIGTSAMGTSRTTAVRTGLAYQGVIAWLELTHPPRRRRALMAALQTMERTVLQADAELHEP